MNNKNQNGIFIGIAIVLVILLVTAIYFTYDSIVSLNDNEKGKVSDSDLESDDDINKGNIDEKDNQEDNDNIDIVDKDEKKDDDSSVDDSSTDNSSIDDSDKNEGNNELGSPSGEYVVASKGLNLRTKPSVDSNIILALANGDELIGYEQEDGWIKVKTSDGTIGYVDLTYLRNANEADNDDSDEDLDQSDEDFTSSKVMSVTAKSVNIRESASVDATVVATVLQGNEVTVVGKSGDWYKVRVKNDTYGYIYGEYLK